MEVKKTQNAQPSDPVKKEEIKKPEEQQAAPKNAPEEVVTRHFAVRESLEEGRRLREALSQVNKEISTLRMERTRFELDLEDMRSKLVRKDGHLDKDAVAQMHEIRQDIVSNDIERLKKTTDITYKIATGSYEVDAEKLVKKWFKEQ